MNNDNHNHNFSGGEHFGNRRDFPMTDNIDELLKDFKNRTMSSHTSDGGHQPYFSSTDYRPFMTKSRMHPSYGPNSYSTSPTNSNHGHYQQSPQSQSSSSAEKTIPIHLERTNNDPAHTSSSYPNEPQFGIKHNFLNQVPPEFHNDSFFANRFRNPFSNNASSNSFSDKMSGDVDGGTSNNDGARVVHIPIQVESRANSTSTNANSGYATSQHQPKPQVPKPKQDLPTSRPSSQADNSYVNQTSNFSTPGSNYAKPQPLASESASFRRPLSGGHYDNHHYAPTKPAPAGSTAGDGGGGGGSIEIPVHVCKSSSTPEATKPTIHTIHKQPSNNSATNINNTSISVNESASDPDIVDPNKVYVMGYEPLFSKEASTTSSVPNDNDVTKTNVPKPRTPFDDVNDILSDLENYKQQVNALCPTTNDDKGFRYLDEMLTRCILRLDCVMVDGNDELRKYRKSAINEVNKVAMLLESKLVSKEKHDLEVRAAQKEEQAIEMNENRSLQPNQNDSLSLEEPKDSNNQESLQSNVKTDSKTLNQDDKQDDKNSKSNKKEKKEKDKKEKKESVEEKPKKRLFVFKKKNKDKNLAIPAAAVSGENCENDSKNDLDPNNNKDDGSSTATTVSTSDQCLSDTSTPNNNNSNSNSFTTMPGRETAV